MRKTAIILGAILASLSLTPAQAVETKSLVIIDSYFDTRVPVSKIVCVASSGCNNVIKQFPTSLSSPINHGDAMVEVAKKQNPQINIIGLRSAISTPTSVNEMNAGDFISALKWVDLNSENIGAVSVSRYFNGYATCSPASTNTAIYGGVSGADKLIKQLISSLKQKGIPVFAATGNKKGSPVDYPACILETNSVSVGNLNKLGNTVSVYTWDANTDYFATGSVYSYKSSILGLIPNTTSAGNVAVATKYVSGLLDNKFVNVLQ